MKAVIAENRLLTFDFLTLSIVPHDLIRLPWLSAPFVQNQDLVFSGR